MKFDNYSLDDLNSVGIYTITTPSGKCYVGMTLDSFKNRWIGHIKKLRNGSHSCEALLRSYEKYGEDQISFKIIDGYEKGKLSQKDCLLLEQKWYDYLYKSRISMLNSRPTGTGSVFHSEETKEKIRRAQKRREFPKAQCLYCLNCFVKKREKYKFCSRECSSLYNNMKLSIIEREEIIEYAKGLYNKGTKINKIRLLILEKYSLRISEHSLSIWLDK